MQAQTPAEGIYKSHDWGDTVMYNVPCVCGDEDHTHAVWVEADDSGVTVSTSTTQQTKWWELNRFKIIWTLLTTGRIEYQASLVMTEQQTLNYVETLKTAMTDVKKFKNAKSK